MLSPWPLFHIFILVSTLLFAQSGRSHSAFCHHADRFWAALVWMMDLEESKSADSLPTRAPSPPHVGSLAHQQGPPWWIGHPSLSSARPSPPHFPLLPPCRAFVSQASGYSSRLDMAERDRQVNMATILFSAFPLSTFSGSFTVHQQV